MQCINSVANFIFIFLSLFFFIPSSITNHPHHYTSTFKMANAATVKDLQAALTFLTTGAKALPEALSKPKVGIVCGSGLGGLVNIIREKVEFSYSDIPGFVNSTGEFRMCSAIRLSLFLPLVCRMPLRFLLEKEVE